MQAATEQTYSQTRNLLRPEQIIENRSELRRMEKQIKHKDVQDRATLARQIKALSTTLERDTPQPFVGAELDRATAEEAALRESLSRQMVTQEEMRRLDRPDTAHRHLAFETTRKADILRWKYLRQRLHAGSEDRNIANLETYRPKAAAPNTIEGIVPHKQFHGLTTNPTPGSAATDAELATLAAVDPELRARFALLTGEQRAQVLGLVRQLSEGPGESAPSRVQKRKARAAKSSLSPEQRKAIGQRLAAARAAKRASK